MRITRTGVAAAALTAALGVGAAVPALAQSADDTTQDTTDSDSTRDAWLEDRAARATERQEAFAAALAEELGLDQATVTAALEQVHEQMAAERADERRAAIEQRLDAAVEDGSLTQEQADALREAAEEGVLGFGHGGDRRGVGPQHLGPGGLEGGAFGPGGPGGAGMFRGAGGPGNASGSA